MNVLVAIVPGAAPRPPGHAALVAKARELAAANGTVSVVLLGTAAAADLGNLGAAGADLILTVDHDPDRADPQRLAAAILAAVETTGATVVLCCHDGMALELVPRVAFALGTSATLDCVGADCVEGELRWQKPMHGGGIIAVCTAATRHPVVLSIRDGVLPPARLDTARTARVRVLARRDAGPPPRLRLIEHEPDPEAGAPLEHCETIVCGGRGLETESDLALLRELADLFGGAVAGTRPLCQRGWLHRDRQIGLTGAKVAPRLYIAVGVSGAEQHMAGLLGAARIVAINKDSGANIFRYAQLGAVGDYREILPEFIATVRLERSGGRREP
jgi:electron transfer flavoprotein alpha subunit